MKRQGHLQLRVSRMNLNPFLPHNGLAVREQGPHALSYTLQKPGNAPFPSTSICKALPLPQQKHIL